MAECARNNIGVSRYLHHVRRLLSVDRVIGAAV